MKIALIADTHWGVRNDRDIFHDASKRFLDDQFFPYIRDRSNDVGAVVHLGDLVDRRKYVNYNTKQRLRIDFLEPLVKWADEYQASTHFIVGNHDVYYRDTNRVNALTEIVKNRYGFTIDERPAEVDFQDLNVLMVPWICDENRLAVSKALEDTKADVVFGHFELKGYEMYKGTVAMHGEDSEFLQRFDTVCSGHFHHRSTDGRINYIGAHAQFTWSDHDDPRGFAVFDTATRQLTYIDNRDTMFHKVWYDDTPPLGIAYPLEMNDKIVRVVVGGKTDQEKFDDFITAIEKQGPAELQIVDQHHNIDLIDTDDVIDETDSTLNIIRGVVDTTDLGVDKIELNRVIAELYGEALQKGA